MRRAATLAAVLGLSLAALGSPLPAQQPEAAPAGFDHQHALWGEVLSESRHSGGLVDYQGLLRDRGRLEAYLASLQSVQWNDFQRWSRKKREAFWINAYNAYAIHLVLEHYPVDSIKDIGSLFRSVFSKEFIPLQHLSASHDDLLSLGEVEHEILFPFSRTPLFHFAIVCASASCPELRNEPYVGSRLDEQLAEQTRKFLADPSRNQQAFDGRTLRVSKIFDWAEDELNAYEGGIPAILRKFGPPAVADDPNVKKPRLKHLGYDWSLNEWKPAD